MKKEGKEQGMTDAKETYCKGRKIERRREERTEEKKTAKEGEGKRT